MSTPDVPTGTWSIDPDATTVIATGKNFLVKSVPATFAVRSGTVVVAADVAASTVTVSLDAASFETGNAKRDEHVRGDDFLQSGSHPTIEFTSDRVTVTGDDVEVAGSLTVAGTSAPVTFRVSGVEVHDDAVGFRATGSVDRRDLGVSKMPSLMIGNTVTIEVAGTARPG